MNVLVTGGAGYLGSVLVGELLKSGHNVTVLDNLMYKQNSLLCYCNNENFSFVHGDVRDEILLGRMMQNKDVVFPLAAIVGFPACERDKGLATEINYRHVLFIAKNFKGKVIYPNTNSGYGQVENGVCTEDQPLNPISHYGVVKSHGEQVVLKHANGISLRLATVFGPSPRMRIDLLVNDFVYKALTDGYVVLFEKDFKRNYISVQDVASAFIFMMENYDKCKGQVFNLGLDDANLTKLELCEKIKEIIPNFSIQCDDIREDMDKRNYVVSNAKIASYGWKPTVSLEKGIKNLIKCYSIIKSNNNNYSNV